MARQKVGQGRDVVTDPKQIQAAIREQRKSSLRNNAALNPEAFPAFNLNVDVNGIPGDIEDTNFALQNGGYFLGSPTGVRFATGRPMEGPYNTNIHKPQGNAAKRR